jgi:PBSX family phage terminase large subunit|nr:MAG TPA: large terminase [Caudoviricetes sp.]
MKIKAVFKFKPFSRKQRKVLNWWCRSSPVRDYNGIIADGAIRSGKSVAMSLSFVIWAMSEFEACNFAMCGKTIGSFRRNVLFWLKLMLRSRGYSVSEQRTENLVIARRGSVENYFYVFGGKDERSQDLIQGITLAGVFFDEVALMPESFVNQATGRCSVDGSKFWFNCNPGSPAHWFKTGWIDKRADKRLLYLHFTMDDNLSLTEAVKERYRGMYTGVFFKRYILGEWKSADGVIYRQFADDPERFILDEVPADIIIGTMGLDFGGNGSAHAGCLVGITRGYRSIVILGEYYRKEVIDPGTLTDDVCGFVQRSQAQVRATSIWCDSAETTLIKGIRTEVFARHIPVEVRNAHKGEIIDRIRLCDMLMSQGRFFIMRRCRHTIAALSEAVWDGKSPTKDKRLDDGSTNIDSLDALEYALEPHANRLIEFGGIHERK